MAERILVVDDEENITDLLASALRFEGFAVEVASTGGDAVEKARRWRPDLILLDVMLPDVEGTAVCRRLRDLGDPVPVVFLTARQDTTAKVDGLALGDDYITKPFSLDELVARVRAVLRRTAPVTAASACLAFDDLVLDVETHEVWRGEAAIELTATEFNLLQYLMENGRRVVSKSEIIDNVWDLGFAGDPNIVETYISYLRRKLDEHGTPLIHTVRGFGYRMRPP